MLSERIFEAVAAAERGLTVQAVAEKLLRITAGPPAVMRSLVAGSIDGDGRFEITAGNRVLLTEAGECYRRLLGNSYVVIDTETTGTKTYRDKITEIAAFKVEDGKIAGSFESLVNPGRYIPFDITKITGITNEMVQDAPLIEEIMPRFLEFLGEGIFVAHNAPFDQRFINAALDEMGMEQLPNDVLCTVKMARKVFPGHRRYNLDSIAQRLGIAIGSRHRAAGDAAATAEVLIEILKNLPDRNMFDLSVFLNSGRKSN